MSPSADEPADFWRSVLPVEAAQTAVRDKPKSTKGASAKTKTTKEASVKTKPKRPAKHTEELEESPEVRVS